MKINQTFKNLKRLKDIGAVFAAHGFSQVVEDLGIGRFMPTKNLGDSGTGPAAPIRMRMAFDELGTTFIKLGQMLSLRPDLIPAEYAAEFKKLQDGAHAMPFSQVIAQIETEFESAALGLYATIEEAPLGQASIAQVHKATLPDGKIVVVKVRRVDIERQIETDLSLLYTIAKLLDDYLPAASVFNPIAIVNEFSRVVRAELDFLQEAQNIDCFARNFAGSETIVIPQVVWELSGQRVLTMDYLNGLPLSRIEELRAAGYDLKALADAGARAFLKMVFVDAVFHGDIHGGNVLALSGSRLGLLDFGVVGRLDERLKRDVASIFLSIVARDWRGVARTYLSIGSGADDQHVSVDLFANDLKTVMEPVLGLPLREIRSALLLEQLATIARRHHLQIPQDLILLGRALGSLEGIARELDPDFNVLELLGEFAGVVIAERYKPERLLVDLVSGLRDLADLSRDLPGQLQSLLRSAERGNLAIEMRLRDPRFFLAMRREAYRVSSAILLAGGAVAVACANMSEHGGWAALFGGALLTAGSVGFLATLLRDFKKL